MRNDEGTKEKIIEVAIECFGKNGYDGTSMRMIAEKSGISKPAIYYYFPDKERLFEGIFKYVMLKYHDMLEEISQADKSAFEKLKEILLSRLRPLQNKFDVKRFMSRMFMAGGKHFVQLDHRKFFRSQEKIIMNIIQQGIDEGAFRSDINKKYFLYALIGTANLYIRDHIMNDETLISEEQAEKILTQLIEGVGQQS